MHHTLIDKEHFKAEHCIVSKWTYWNFIAVFYVIRDDFLAVYVALSEPWAFNTRKYPSMTIAIVTVHWCICA